jgi:hypothetical protein
MRKLKGFLMRPMTLKESQAVKRLLREGERLYGTSDNVGHKVQEYVQENMIKLGLRIKVKPRRLKERLPLKGERYYMELYEQYFGEGTYERKRDEL